MSRIVSAVLAILSAGMLAAQSEVPKLVNIQGFLVDEQGEPVDGTVSMVFDLYDAQVGGTLIKRVGPMIVEVDAGVYSAGLGLDSDDFAGPNNLVHAASTPPSPGIVPLW